MANEQVSNSLFTWIVSTITSAIFAGLAWLGIHTKRLNELNTKIQVAAARELMRDEKMLDIQTNIKEMKASNKIAMADIRGSWDKQLKLITAIQSDSTHDHQNITSILMNHTESMIDHDKRIDLIEKRKNFKIVKG